MPMTTRGRIHTQNQDSQAKCQKKSSFHNDDDTIRKILESTTIIALVGASDNHDRPSNEVMKILLDYGYRVIPINPRLQGTQLMGETVLGSLDEIPALLSTCGGGTDMTSKTTRPPTGIMVDIFRKSESAGDIVDQAIALGPPIVSSVWMQIDVIDDDAAQRAVDAGLQVAMNVCPAEEIPRLAILTPNSRAAAAVSTKRGRNIPFYQTPQESGRVEDKAKETKKKRIP